MEPATTQTAFQPYKVISAGRSNLQLQPPASIKAAMTIFRLTPLLMAAIGVVLYLVQGELFYLLIFGGVALFEAIVFSFFKLPAAVSIDSMGFTLETVSLKGRKENYYLWSEVDYLRHRMVSGKNSITLNYMAVLKDGKKVSFLNFNNYHRKKQSIPEINTVLHNISKKEIREK